MGFIPNSSQFYSSNDFWVYNFVWHLSEQHNFGIIWTCHLWNCPQHYSSLLYDFRNDEGKLVLKFQTCLDLVFAETLLLYNPRIGYSRTNCNRGIDEFSVISDQSKYIQNILSTNYSFWWVMVSINIIKHFILTIYIFLSVLNTYVFYCTGNLCLWIKKQNDWVNARKSEISVITQ